MEEKENLITKANFYFNGQLKCHIKVAPMGFVNGMFCSELIDGLYYWFEDLRYPGKKTRLFLIDMHDIRDYEEEE